jgi:hypothetical protein
MKKKKLNNMIQTYKAIILNQVGTNIPNVLNIQNSLPSTPVWERRDVGKYVAFLDNAFPENKTFISGFSIDGTVFMPLAVGQTIGDYLYTVSILAGAEIVVFVCDKNFNQVDLSEISITNLCLPTIEVHL